MKQKKCKTEGCENLTDGARNRQYCLTCLGHKAEKWNARTRARRKAAKKPKYCKAGHCEGTEIFGNARLCDVCRPIMAAAAAERKKKPRQVERKAIKMPVLERAGKPVPSYSTEPVLTTTHLHIQSLEAMGLHIRQGAYPAGDIKIYTREEIEALVEAGGVTDLNEIRKPVKKPLLPYKLV